MCIFGFKIFGAKFFNPGHYKKKCGFPNKTAIHNVYYYQRAQINIHAEMFVFFFPLYISFLLFTFTLNTNIPLVGYAQTCSVSRLLSHIASKKSIFRHALKF